MDAAADRPFLDALGRLGPALLQALDALEHARRRLHPPDLPGLRAAMAPLRPQLDAALGELGQVAAPPGIEELREELSRAGRAAARALALFLEDGSPSTAVPRILGAMHEHCRAQAALFPLRKALPPISRFFLEEPFHSRLAELDPDVVPAGIRVGLHRAGEDGARGGFCLYVPESYDGSEEWPLVVALHGGSGNGADFLWSWLVEARGRRFLLLAPTARGSTWSLDAPEIDALALRSMVEFVATNWRVDGENVLLTGLSDGATFALLCGLRDDMPFTALAPVSGVFHPMNFANGNLERARGRRIYLVHGALDWMFPVQIARMARDELERAGADLVYREIADLSHTYPREENDRILSWLAPRLALPGARC
jgi:phospholipase/carboxylesterase